MTTSPPYSVRWRDAITDAATLIIGRDPTWLVAAYAELDERERLTIWLTHGRRPSHYRFHVPPTDRWPRWKIVRVRRSRNPRFRNDPTMYRLAIIGMEHGPQTGQPVPFDALLPSADYLLRIRAMEQHVFSEDEERRLRWRDDCYVAGMWQALASV